MALALMTITIFGAVAAIASTRPTQARIGRYCGLRARW